MNRDDVNITSADHVMAKILGLRIMSGKETEDGLHMELEGGQLLIFTGPVIVALYMAHADPEKMH